METVEDLQEYVLEQSASVRHCVQTINKNRDNIALIVSGEKKLIGTVTDGDIRRHLLKGGSLDDSCKTVVWERPILASLKDSEDSIRELMSAHRITSIPLVDEKKRPIRIARIHDLVASAKPKTVAVIMAGGEGKRLKPLTENIPKPMVDVGGSPILQRIISSLRESGVTDIFISVNYLADVIEDYFGDGANHGVRISYLKEEDKMGTCGALSMLPKGIARHFLVINGDVVTDVDLGRIASFHREQRVVMTVAAVNLKIKVPYGVFKLSDHFISGIEEKPEKQFFCSAGIYVIDHDAVSLIPENTSQDMPELMQLLIDRGLPVTMFPIHEYWLDIGERANLEEARKTASKFSKVTNPIRKI